jgi:hypothetical protein
VAQVEVQSVVMHASTGTQTHVQWQPDRIRDPTALCWLLIHHQRHALVLCGQCDMTHLSFLNQQALYDFLYLGPACCCQCNPIIALASAVIYLYAVGM